MDLINWSLNEIDTICSSLEDIEDIYLFGTVITGLLLIGLGLALVYRNTKEMVSAVKGPIKLPVMIECMARAVGTQTVVINRTMDTIQEKVAALERDRSGDQEGHFYHRQD